MIKIGDKEYRNLEEQVAFLTQKSTLASLGLHFKGFVSDTSELPMENAVDGDTYGVGTQPPYRYYAYNGGAYSDIGTFPQEGPRGIQGDQGPEGKQGPRGEKGPAGPQGIAGPAGKNGSGIGVDKITDINLAAGEPLIEYNETNGGTVAKQGRIIAAGQNYSIQVDDKIPIIPGKNVSIKPNAANSALVFDVEQAVQSVNGKKGAVVLKTSDLQNDSGFITNKYHDNDKQDKLVSGKNIKTINNESILGEGNINIGGGGTAGVTSLNSKTGAIVLRAGTNVTIDESGNTLTINATGGGGGGTVELPFIELTLTQNTYPITSEFTDSDAEKLTKDYFSSILFKPSGSVDYIPMLPQASDRANHEYIWQGHDENYTYTITGTLQKVSDADNSYVWTAKSYTINQETWSNSNVKQTTGFYRYDGIVNTNPVVGGTYQYNDSLTLYEYTNGCTYTQGQMIIDRNGVISKVIDPTHARVAYIPQSGGGATYEVVEITSSQTTITDEQYNTLIASPFNKIKLNNIIYDLYKETSAELTYTANYFNNGDQITIKKSTKAVSTGSLSSLIAISAFVKNDLNYNQSNNRFALSAYQGKVLNDRLTAVENGGGTIYQHTITYNSDHFASDEAFSNEVQGSFYISFYSTHGHFNDASEFWTWLIGRGAIDTPGGYLWGSMGGETTFNRITVLGNTDAEKYIKFESFGGYGEWTAQQYLKNPTATGLTDTMTDGFRDM